MSTALEIEHEVSLERMAIAVAEEVKQTGKEWAAVARKHARSLNGVPFIGDLVEGFAVGLAERARSIHKSQHSGFAQATTPSRGRHGRPATKQERVTRLVSDVTNALWRILPGTESNKPFAEFDHEDRSMFSGDLKAQANGHLETAAFVDKADDLCTQRRVNRVADLAPSDQMALLQEVPW